MFHLTFTPSIPLGEIVITPAAAKRLSVGDVTMALRRHARGDLGDFDEPDPTGPPDPAQECRRHSAYRTADGTPFWIITEQNPPHTTVLLPEEY